MKEKAETVDPTHGKQLPGTKKRKRPIAYRRRKLGKLAR